LDNSLVADYMDYKGNKEEKFMSYETYHTPSWDWQMAVDHYEGKRYQCEYCGCGLDNHEVFLVGGKPYCGCCK
jgi:hypothetical protein